MKNILAEIIDHKYKELATIKNTLPVAKLEKSVFFDRTCISLKKALLESKHHGIIAEFKRKSPSKGAFNDNFSVEEITTGYVAAGAAGLSVLTDSHYFGGTLGDLTLARTLNPSTALLRKDFMVDEYQVLAAKACGADVILLIAAGIETKLLNRLARFAKSLGLETLLEIKEQEELEGNLSEYIDIVGVNNRSLKNFTVDVNSSITLCEHIPDSFVKISESGINKAEVVHKLKGYGYKGFLMGEAFMQTPDPVMSIKEFVNSLD
ncbi:MAG TPA: indole-3-glycerol phosphate synthase TrpC [Cytophagales bacterium]|nr:indole-3-glycerol phosphate synthase TrpC [Cytophagales bacterium]